MTTSDSTITPGTRVELGVVAMFATALVSAIVAGSVWCTRISIGQQQLADEIAELRALVERGVDDRWHRADMRAWVERANREVELWSVETEHRLGLEEGDWKRFSFPDVD